MAVTNQDIIDATIRCAYRIGLPAVTISAIGKEVGILGQGLYNHFSSKDDILTACFSHCKSQIADLFRNYELDPADDTETAIKKLWMRYFNYFVNHPAECAFYRNYQELTAIPYHDKEAEDAYLKDVKRLVGELDAKTPLFTRIPPNVVLYYVRNVTPYLARAVSDHIMDDTPEMREQLWLLAANGLSLMWTEE